MNSINVNRLAFTINIILDQLGAILFVTMLFVIVKYRQLHDSPCLKLIGLFTLCCLCSKFIIILPYLIAVIPLRNVPLLVCFAVQLLPFSLVSDLMPVTVAIGFDRLLSVFFPIWYSMKRTSKYWFAVCICMVVYPSYLAYFMVINLTQNAWNQTSCTTKELYGPDVEPNDFSWYLNYSTIVFYAIMVLKLLWDGREGRRAYFNRQPIIKSLALIVAIQVLGQWALNGAYRYIPPLLATAIVGHQEQMPLIYYGINCFSSLLTTSQFVCIYYTSSMHRKLLMKEFPRFFRHFPLKTERTVRPVQRNNFMMMTSLDGRAQSARKVQNVTMESKI